MKKKKYIPLIAGISIISLAMAVPALSQEGAIEEVEEVEEILPFEAQDTIFNEQGVVIPPLFEYPTAPDDSPSLEARTNYLMDHFWDPMDFKNSKVVDQNALNHAFSVYTGAMPYADPEKVMASIKDLISKIKGNTGLTYQFARAAEENLYGPRADMWIDEVYIPFLENLMANKKLDSNKKSRYQEQLKILKSTQPGQTMPQFEYADRKGAKSQFKISKPYTLVEFGNPECEDCHLAQFRLQISGSVNDMISDGLLEVAFIIPEEDAGDLLAKTESYPEKWTVGAAAEDLFEKLDLRATPAIYLIDGKGKIIAKNVGPETAITILEQSVKSDTK